MSIAVLLNWCSIMNCGGKHWQGYFLQQLNPLWILAGIVSAFSKYIGWVQPSLIGPSSCQGQKFQSYCTVYCSRKYFYAIHPKIKIHLWEICFLKIYVCVCVVCKHKKNMCIYHSFFFSFLVRFWGKLKIIFLLLLSLSLLCIFFHSFVSIITLLLLYLRATSNTYTKGKDERLLLQIQVLMPRLAFLCGLVILYSLQVCMDRYILASSSSLVMPWRKRYQCWNGSRGTHTTWKNIQTAAS